MLRLPYISKTQRFMNTIYTSDFAGAITALKEGRRVTREGWNGKGMWLALQTPDEHSKMKRPYIYISIVTGELVPWVASHGDLFGNDWKVISE
jgi:hypothetical protein